LYILTIRNTNIILILEIIYCYVCLFQISEGLKSTFMRGLAVGDQFSVHDSQDKITVEFRSLQYAIFLTMFVEIIGALFFFLTALHIQKDKALVDLAIAGK